MEHLWWLRLYWYVKYDENKDFLTLSWWRPLSYRNQSIDLQSKSVDWFLYDNGLHHERVKLTAYIFSTKGYHYEYHPENVRTFPEQAFLQICFERSFSLFEKFNRITYLSRLLVAKGFLFYLACYSQWKWLFSISVGFLECIFSISENFLKIHIYKQNFNFSKISTYINMIFK